MTSEWDSDSETSCPPKLPGVKFRYRACFLAHMTPTYPTICTHYFFRAPPILGTCESTLCSSWSFSLVYFCNEHKHASQSLKNGKTMIFVHRFLLSQRITWEPHVWPQCPKSRTMFSKILLRASIRVIEWFKD